VAGGFVPMLNGVGTRDANLGSEDAGSSCGK